MNSFTEKGSKTNRVPIVIKMPIHVPWTWEYLPNIGQPANKNAANKAVEMVPALIFIPLIQ